VQIKVFVGFDPGAVPTHGMAIEIEYRHVKNLTTVKEEVMKKAFPSIVISVALSFTLVTTATASVVIDSSSGTPSIFVPLSAIQRGIEFTTGNAGPYTINDLKVNFNVSVISDYTVNAGIYDVVSNLPNSLKASAILPIHATSTGYHLYDFNSVALNSLGTYSLASDTLYALIFSGSSSSNVQLSRNGSNVSSYSVFDGFSVDYSVAKSGSWINNPNQNYYLQLDVTGPAAVPEPSTYALISLGIGGLALWKRRQKKS
jgi:hypothetical protein